MGRPSLVQGARACVPLSTTFVHSRRARRRRICATRRRGSGPPTARPTPNHREARRHTTRTACSTALRQSSRGPEKGPRSPVVPNGTRSHAYPTIPCHPRADPARSRGGPRWSSLVLAPCRRPSADVLARARACTERPQPALARAFGADWCPSRTVPRTRALRATHALAQSSAQRQRESAPSPRAAAGARACDPSLAVGVRRASFRAKIHVHHKTHTLLWSPTVVSTCAQWRNGGQRQRAGPCLRATCTHGCAGRRGHAKDCPGSRARASPADRYGGKSLTAVVPAARQPSSRAVGWTRASDFLPAPPRVCPVHPLARCRASEAESSAESGRPGTAEAGHACWGERRRDCVSCSHSRLEVPRQVPLSCCEAGYPSLSRQCYG